MEIKATIQKILPTEQIDTKGGVKPKQIIVFGETIEKKDGGTFDKTYAVEFFGDSVEYLTQYKEGDLCEVTCSVSSRHWKDDKYFTSISGRFIKKVESAAEDIAVGSEKEDLPF